MKANLHFFPAVFPALIAIHIASAQIVIDQNDMPGIGDTIRYDVTYNISGINYTATGSGFTWDFSDLGSLLPQEADTFVHVWSTPILYQLVFLYPFVANLASPQEEFTLIPGFQMTEVFNFYKNTSSSYNEVGKAFTVNDLPLPFLYSEPDVIYRFPLQFSDLDSNTCEWNVGLPGLGYYGSTLKRKNHADGWGTVITPFGTFEALRVKTTVEQRDSVYVDTLGFGFAFNYDRIEYQWLAKGFGRPLVKVTESGILPPVIEYLNFPEVTLTVDLGTDQHICLGETTGIKAEVTGGTPPYYYLWNTFQFGDSITVTPEGSTLYSVWVTDSELHFATDSVWVWVHPPPVVNAGQDTSIILTTAFHLNGSAAGGIPPYSYEWSPSSWLSDPTIPDPLCSPPFSTEYTLSVTDSLGCTGQDKVLIEVIQVPVHPISGTVNESVTGQGLTGVEIGFTGLMPVITDAQGSYSKDVHEGWSGTAKPAMEDYYFVPDSVVYNNVTGPVSNQDYLAFFVSPPEYLIAGTITDQQTGNPAAGISLIFEGFGNAMTNDTGYYSLNVPEGWSGTVTPVGYLFDPPSRSYVNIMANFPDEDYVRLQGGLPPGWNVTPTNSWHLLNIPLDANPRIYGTPISTGDYIGVFYIDTEGIEQCGGAVSWTGSSAVNMTAYGDDPGTSVKEGFDQLENFIWKIYHWSSFSEYYAEAEYHWLFLNDGKFHNMGFSRLTDLEVMGVALDIRAFLEGCYQGSAMSVTLNNNGLLPLSQPYSILPWIYTGTEEVSAIPNSHIVDWVLIEVRENTTKGNPLTEGIIVSRQAGFIRDNGLITGLNGASKMVFQLNSVSDLFPVIYHRNHLAITSQNPMILCDGRLVADLTSLLQVSGGTLAAKEIAPGCWAMIAGDGNANGQINNPDKNSVWMPQSGTTGYLSGDFNMDGQVNNQDKNDYWAPNCGRGTQVVAIP
ncbi:MAG: hypothetical protein JW861_11555 [Bacteroidales bacterium]|nr:hypothetical protein [Bacteroidales bacterium]